MGVRAGASTVTPDLDAGLNSSARNRSAFRVTSSRRRHRTAPERSEQVGGHLLADPRQCQGHNRGVSETMPARG
jgi:hypothetical protein